MNNDQPTQEASIGQTLWALAVWFGLLVFFVWLVKWIWSWV